LATSDTSICNSALIKLGAEPISSLDDATKEARLCKLQYPILRDELLRSHPWNFAIARKQLAKTLILGEFEFDNQFALPSDCLRIWKTDLNLDGGGKSEERWAVETDAVTQGRVLVTNASAVKIKYIKKITDVSLFDANFSESLSFKIAADIAYSLVQSITLQQQMNILYERSLAVSRSFDAQEGSVEQIESFEWLDSRL
jgi:hypothetical protein